MDIADQSDVEIQNYIANNAVNGGLKRHDNTKLHHTGFCHNLNCEQEVSSPKLFCNGDCATEFDIATRKK